MALWEAMSFPTRRAMVDWLNGAIISPARVPAVGLDLDGLTLIIDAGAGNKTVTFAPAKSRPWTMTEIVAAIGAADASLVGIASRLIESGDRPVAPEAQGSSRLKLVRDGAITVVSTGTANARFGFSAIADTVSAKIPKTDVVSIQRPSTEQDTWIVVTNG
jgi:hypothetical protein